MSLPFMAAGMSRLDFEQSAAGYILAGLEEAIHKHGEASLFLSGGSTPGPIYEKLSKASCDWHKINIGLVDERWVGEKDKGSNAALIRRTLLKDAAKAAHFRPMKTAHKTAEFGQKSVEKSYQLLFKAPSIAVLGMGLDGHICSWFFDATGFHQAINPDNSALTQAITANPTETTGVYLERMTLTLSALEHCDKILLLISGHEKKSVLEAAIQSNGKVLPVSYLLNMVKNKPKNPLTILHAA